MKIVGYLKTSLIEWPGKISSVVFVPGCNFRCPFCHNSDLVDPKKIKRLKEYSEKSIFEDLKKRKKWVDGAVVTGGEPTLQKDLPGFLQKCRELGFETMIETNGSKPGIISLIVNRKSLMVDYLTLDFKGPLDENYGRVVGVKNFDPKTWIKSFCVILESNIPFELRTTVVPGIHNKDILLEMAKQLKQLAISNLPRQQAGQQLAKIVWYLQDFQPKNCLDPRFNKIKSFSKMEMEKFLKAVRKIIPKTELRGF